MQDVSGSPLFNEILENPDDRELRLVFADWLEEEGDPRSQLVRFQCQLDGMTTGDKGYSTLRAKERKLFRQFGAFGTLPEDFKAQWEPRAGFIEWIQTTPTRFLNYAEELCARAPVRELLLKGPCSRFADIAKLPELAQIRSIELKQSKINQASFAALVRSPHLSGLKSLRLHSDELGSSTSGAASAVDFANASFIQGLEELRLSGTEINNTFTQVIAFSDCNLRSLTLGYEVFDPALRSIGHSAGLRSLQELNLSGRRQQFTADGLQAFGDSEFEVPLKKLAIRPVASGFASAFASPRFEFLEKLEVAWTNVGNTGLHEVLNHLNHLVDLRISEGGITDEGARALANSPLLGKLQKVHLTSNSITVKGVKALLESDYFTKKTKFYLNANNISRREIKDIQDRAGKSFGNFASEYHYRY